MRIDGAVADHAVILVGRGDELIPGQDDALLGQERRQDSKFHPRKIGRRALVDGPQGLLLKI